MIFKVATLCGILYSIFSPRGIENYGFSRTEPIKVSWYGEPFHGRRTANGEAFDMYGFTCASPTIQFNTLITLRCGNRYITVRVNDRGPYRVDEDGKAVYPLQPHPVRRLDLSREAFKHLVGDLGVGVADVYVVSIRKGE